MATFEIVSEHVQALLKIDHSSYKRSLGRFLAIDGEFYWSAVKWDRDVLRIPGKCPFESIDEWDCVHWQQGIAIMSGKLVSNSEKSKCHGVWRTDKLYRVTAKNDMLRFNNVVACQHLINQYAFNYVLWESQSDYWTAFLLAEAGELQPNFRLWTDGPPSLTINQRDLTAMFYPNSDESTRLISIHGRNAIEFYDHKLATAVRAVSGVNANAWEKLWIAVVDQPTELHHDDEVVELNHGLWIIKHPVVTV